MKRLEFTVNLCDNLLIFYIFSESIIAPLTSFNLIFKNPCINNVFQLIPIFTYLPPFVNLTFWLELRCACRCWMQKIIFSKGRWGNTIFLSTLDVGKQQTMCIVDLYALWTQILNGWFIYTWTNLTFVYPPPVPA